MKYERSRITDASGRKVVVERNRSGSTRPSPASQRTSSPPRLRAVVEVKRKLDELSSRVRRLAPPHAGDPERFHVDRSEIAAELQRLAERLCE